MKSVLIAPALIAVLGSMPAAALCSGQATVKLRFFNHQGNFCPTISDPTRDCSSTQYDESEFDVNENIANTKIYLVRTGTTSVIGSAVTDASGSATITWVDPICFGSMSATVNWRFEQADDRFAVKDDTGATWSAGFGPFTLNNGGNQNLGTWTRGNPTTPDPLSNVYGGASRMWDFALVDSARMRSFFTNVDILAFDTGSVCPTSCASGKTVLLDPDAEFRPQARIMHEMGHVASTLAHPSQTYQYGGCYTFPSTSCSGGSWTLTGSSAEWSAAAFEEGMATFAGDRAIYWQGNDDPRSCNSTSFCSDANNTTSVEFTANAACTTGSTGLTTDDRTAMNVNRFLRDLYDSNSDYTNDSVASSYASIYDSLNEFGTGTGDGGKNEPWDSGLSTVDDHDGHCTTDFDDAFLIQTGVDPTNIRLANCDQPGD